MYVPEELILQVTNVLEGKLKKKIIWKDLVLKVTKIQSILYYF